MMGEQRTSASELDERCNADEKHEGQDKLTKDVPSAQINVLIGLGLADVPLMQLL